MRAHRYVFSISHFPLFSCAFPFLFELFDSQSRFMSSLGSFIGALPAFSHLFSFSCWWRRHISTWMSCTIALFFLSIRSVFLKAGLSMFCLLGPFVIRSVLLNGGLWTSGSHNFFAILLYLAFETSFLSSPTHLKLGSLLLSSGSLPTADGWTDIPLTEVISLCTFLVHIIAGMWVSFWGSQYSLVSWGVWCHSQISGWFLQWLRLRCHIVSVELSIGGIYKYSSDLFFTIVDWQRLFARLLGFISLSYANFYFWCRFCI